MNPQTWWYLARASGIVTWLLVTASVIWGILLSTDLFAGRRRPAWLLDLHRGLGALSVIGALIHVAALIADSWVHFDVVDVLVPLASEWKPWQVALGVVSFWGLVILEVTSIAIKRLPRRVWRAVHLGSYVTFVTGSLHGTFAGSDAANPLYAWTSIAVSIALTVLVVHRIARPTRVTGVRTDGAARARPEHPEPGERAPSRTRRATPAIGSSHDGRTPAEPAPSRPRRAASASGS